MRLNDWMIKFLNLDGAEAESVAIALAAVIRKDEDALKRLYEKLGHGAKMKE